MMDLKTVTRAAGCIALIVAVAACSKKEEPMSVAPAPVMEERSANAADNVTAQAPPPAPAAPAAESAGTAVTAATTSQQMGSSAATFVDGERKFIRTAGASFRVKDVYVAALGIEDTVGAHGGFVVTNNIGTKTTNTERYPVGDGKMLELNEVTVTGKLTVRVPSAKTQEFLRAIVNHIVFLDERNFEARDAQFELLRKQLDAIRSQETQTDLGQAIQDGGKLTQKTEAIGARHDVKAARDAALLEKKEFEDRVAFSTINLTLYQPAKIVKTEYEDLESVFRKSRPGFFSRMGDEMRGGWDGLLEFVLVLVRIWPVLLIGGLVALAVWRFRSYRRKARALQ